MDRLYDTLYKHDALNKADEHLVFSGLAPDYDPLFTLEAGDLVVYKVAAACSASMDVPKEWM